VGRLSGHGLELSLDALAISRPGLTWRAGLVFAADRSKVTDLGCGTDTTSNLRRARSTSQQTLAGRVRAVYGPSASWSATQAGQAIARGMPWGRSTAPSSSRST